MKSRLLQLTFVVVLAVLLTAACGRAGPQLIEAGNRAFEEQDYEAAAQSYQQAREEAPDLAEPRYNEANAHYRNGELELAQSAYESALLDAEAELEQHGVFNLGNTFFKSENLAEAIDAYKEALRLDPGDTDAKYNLELALAQLQTQEQAEEQQDGGEPGEQNGGDPDEAERTPPEQREQSEQEQAESAQAQSQGEEDEQEPTGATERTTPQELTEEQALQLLESVARNTETLQSRLQQVFVASGQRPEQDW